VRDLDGYIENHKRTIPDEFSAPTKFPVLTASNQTRNGSRRAG
jgi:hypothetical protein